MLPNNPFLKAGYTAIFSLALSVSAMAQQREVTTKTPVALRDDIQIEEYMKVEPEAVRIIRHPVTGEIYYTTFFGDVLKIVMEDGKPVSKKLLSVEDHGIPRLQGAAFHGNTLFLAGNVSVNNNKGNKGRMVRYEMNTGAEKPLMTVVFNTVEYGANKTTFDHGWNALEISLDGKYIFVNTGARTDHGEVQDNDNNYPNARDNGLTANIFRFPIQAKDLLLGTDAAKLKADGYLYAEGIRNAYDMAFDPKGNLFAVSNSGDYDHPEDMFWVRKGHHYGFPWVMGGIETPQQYPDYQPDPEKDPFLSKFAFAWLMKYFHNDPDFPKRPAGVTFTPSVQNMGPDANEYRDRKTGIVMDGDTTGVTVGTFNAHSSPLGLFFDNNKALGKDLTGDGFVIRYTGGPRNGVTNPSPLRRQGRDLLHLELAYDKAADNYKVKTTRIIDGFTSPTDALLVDNTLYIIEYGGKQGGNKAGGSIWKITMPAADKIAKKSKKSTK
ncbi:PQQ-dependent sugar dehydrogenase [Dyadobacter sandarakinus]|uniref:PQQ-dependent sugar dehydrogenase n=1 Tax=Dyadobacter sandarakinus TaxID=2747268 RepID=A0ABX7I5C1_9BACT|nr:PQQ-dependent sugar dehydrogenase [Dyadobacter sandarakinus]QRR01058.1 PQQ-dependent sugar dehydrogenase [Dyadobacter sandarakinus]